MNLVLNRSALVASTWLLFAACASEPPIETGEEPERPARDAGRDLEDAGDRGPGQVDEEPAPPMPGTLGGNCTALRREALGSVATVSTAEVTLVDEVDGVRTLYVDASGGGFQTAATSPYVYLDLDEGRGLPLSDFDADESEQWDLAFKRFTIRTNSGDSGPGLGSAAPYDVAFGSLSLSQIDESDLSTDEFIDDETCETVAGDQGVGGVYTAFSGWYAYESGTMVLSPVPAVYVVRAADGVTHYELELLDYYGTPEGARGQVSGRYLLRYARLQ